MALGSSCLCGQPLKRSAWQSTSLSNHLQGVLTTVQAEIAAITNQHFGARLSPWSECRR